MCEMNGKAVGNQFRTTIVCIDRYDNTVLCGRIYNPYLEEGIQFQSTMDFLKVMESLLGSMNFPQSFSGNRSFRAIEENKTSTPASIIHQEGELATFALKVLFRQNASWQGSIKWIEGKQEESFRSVMELLFLFDSALDFVSNSSECNC